MSKNLKNRAASLRTDYALDHHAKVLAPIKRALQDALDFSGLMHRVVSVKGGQNSWRLELGDGRWFALRGYPKGNAHIQVRQHGSTATLNLTSARDALRFVDGL